MVLRLLLFRECTRLTGFDVLDLSRGAPCVVPTSQTAVLRCVNVAQVLVPLTKVAQRLRQSAIGRHPITGAWLLDDAARPV